MTGPERWVDSRIGLQFFPAGSLVYYLPDAPFYVDGIRYDVNCGGPAHKRLMVEIVHDGRTNSGATMKMSRPPTEDELDLFVLTGLVEGWTL